MNYDNISAEDYAELERESNRQHAHSDWLRRIADGRLFLAKVDWPENIAEYMRGDVSPPELLVNDWIVKGVLHWLYSDAEAGKTWVALHIALQVMRAGGVVLWVDEELGGQELGGRRLTALGATPEEVEYNFLYYPFPGWNFEDEQKEAWEQLVTLAKPDLVVFDTATDMLTEADLDENKGKDVTAWVKAYCEPPTREGAATLVLDHTGKADGGTPGKHAVGSRGKRAKAKVQFALISKERYDRNTLGRIEVLLTKNTLGAELPKERSFKVGGDGESNFVFESVASIRDAANTELLTEIVDFLREHKEADFSQTQMVQAINGPAAKVRDALKWMSSKDSTFPVKVTLGARNALRYSYDSTAEDFASDLVASSEKA